MLLAQGLVVRQVTRQGLFFRLALCSRCHVLSFSCLLSYLPAQCHAVALINHYCASVNGVLSCVHLVVTWLEVVSCKQTIKLVLLHGQGFVQPAAVLKVWSNLARFYCNCDDETAQHISVHRAATNSAQPAAVLFFNLAV